MSLLEDLVDEVVREYLTHRKSPHFADHKIIHDSLWGTQRFRPWEVALLETPLVQRLRRIHQTALVFLTYPSATHTRFEHTIGVAYLVRRLARSACKNSGRELEPECENNLRAAAILHDIGHGPFSHISEQSYEAHPLLTEYVNGEQGLADASPHEVLSYLMVRSPAFREHVRELNSEYKINLDPDIISELIVGIPREGVDKYILETLNGGFDADKLDYIRRDGYFSGLPLRVDLDRLLFSTSVIDMPGSGLHLAVDVRGAVAVEQIIFSKTVLFSSVYHHHKVRACDCLYFALVERALELRSDISGVQIETPVSLLRLTDSDFLQSRLPTKDALLEKLASRLRWRDVLKRALVISMKTFDETSAVAELLKLRHPTLESQQKVRDLREKICERVGGQCSVYEIWLDLPDWPTLGPGLIRDSMGQPVFIKKLFPTEEWIDNYKEHKWRGHVFAPLEFQDRASQAAEEVFEEELGVSFKPEARKLAKLPELAE